MCGRNKKEGEKKNAFVTIGTLIKRVQLYSSNHVASFINSHEEIPVES